VNATAPRVD